MKYTLKRSVEYPYIHCNNNVVTDVNEGFTNLAGYTKDEMMQKSLKEAESLLRIGQQQGLENLMSSKRVFLFTKNLKAVEAEITCIPGSRPHEKYYSIKAKPSPGLKDKLPYIASVLEENEVGVGIYSITDGILLDINKKMMEFAKWSSKEALIGRAMDEIINIHGSEAFSEIFKSVVKTHKTYNSKEVKRPDGKGAFTYWDLSLVPVEITKTKYLIITAFDITEKVLTRKKVEEQNEELEAIIENMSDSLVIFDKNGTYKKINKACRNNFMFDMENTRNITDVHNQVSLLDRDGNPLNPVNTPARRVLNGETISGFREIVKTKTKTFHTEISGTPVFDGTGSFMAGILLIHDVTDKVKTQESILVKTQLNLLKNVIENLQVGVIRCSYPDFKILDINSRAYEELIIFNPQEGPITSIQGRDYFETFKDIEKDNIDNKLKEFWQRKSSSFNHIKHYVTREDRFLKVIYQPLFGLNRQIMEFLMLIIDISDEVKAKRNMEEVLQLQEELFTNIAHELKTPLNVIFSTDQLLEYYLKNNQLELKKDKVSNGINVIKQNCYRLTKLVNNIVDLSKIDTGFLSLNMSNENIVQITEDIVQSVTDYIKERRLNITFDTNTEEKIISCDCDKIERIILNLLSNAIKFTNPGGSIFVNLFDRGDWIEISVKDTGIGIDKKYQQHIFERFRQVDKSLSRNTEGSGIGLSLVKSIVELHNGTIAVDSEAGKGSTFTVNLPATIREDGVKANYFMTNKVEMIKVEFSDIYSI